jgi:hypothetical protein
MFNDPHRQAVGAKANGRTGIFVNPVTGVARNLPVNEVEHIN